MEEADRRGCRMESVYISGALMGARDLEAVRSLYESFATACESAGWIPYLPHQNTDPVVSANLTGEEVVSRDLLHLGSAGVVLAYLGEPSLGVGAELAIAMQMGKPIIALYESTRRVSRFALGLIDRYPLGMAYTFSSVDQACNIIVEALKRSGDRGLAGDSLISPGIQVELRRA
jgi:hypothetical protein